ncbi:MAG: hypothetical protein JWM10_3917 [Myxococcaceae bacterium]|nr:hypothetical protein [Myxococcaceae bacterium]
MSSEVIARLETLLDRVVTRRAQPRVAPAPVIVAATAPKPIAPEALRPEAPRFEARRPEGPVEARKPEAPVEKPAAPAAELRKPEAAVERPSLAEPRAFLELPVEPTLVARRAIEPLSTAPDPAAESSQAPQKSVPLPGPARVSRPDDRIAASFAAGASVSPGLGEDDADHVETLAFRVGRALPRPLQVPAPPLPVVTRDESGERRSERFSPALPATPVAAPVSAAPVAPAAASLRSLLQRSVALRPRG